MRLTQFEIDSIKTQAETHFGENVKVYLFGSRTDDTKKGGDIDLYIANQHKEHSTLKSKLNFIADLIFKIGEQKIDVVLESSNVKGTVFYKSIMQNAILL